MGGITAYDFSSSVAYREILGLGRQEGRQEGRQTEASAITVRQLQRRCGTLSSAQQAPVFGRSPQRGLEALLDALLDFQGPENLNTWLSRHAS
jgi:hypothetical protein